MTTAAAIANQIRTIDPDEERAFMDAIDRWMERIWFAIAAAVAM